MRKYAILSDKEYLCSMMNGAIVVVAGESSFAYFAAKLGLNVDVVLVQGKPLMGNPGNNDSIAGVVLAGCTALYWEMLTMCDVRRRHKVRSLLLIPHDSTRILDFNLKDIDEEKKYLITESLKCCDLMYFLVTVMSRFGAHFTQFFSSVQSSSSSRQ